MCPIPLQEAATSVAGATLDLTDQRATLEFLIETDGGIGPLMSGQPAGLTIAKGANSCGRVNDREMSEDRHAQRETFRWAMFDLPLQEWHIAPRDSMSFGSMNHEYPQ